ncbi:reverse transcriptase domain-containing protein [Enterococcus mundtii]|uniref:reverse transcriptase domain-containing protein n=1 Tax=Enterococcus TaxID=1350 RepID=UPI0009BD148D|nr:reverse transcriptase domain-containing protein [Enterococcus mundtii]RYT04670.1 hypothetical protein EAI87_06330 [Enterococcus mundtii]
MCCHPNGELPQGSPVSPIISNIICHKMDQQINRFCRKYKCVYTRYAYDISISYHYLKIPHQIAKKSSDLVEIATALEQIINENGFEIQNMKNEITAYGIDNLLFEKDTILLYRENIVIF